VEKTLSGSEAQPSHAICKDKTLASLYLCEAAVSRPLRCSCGRVQSEVRSEASDSAAGKMHPWLLTMPRLPRWG
jgi:hypothetical protein